MGCFVDDDGYTHAAGGAGLTALDVPAGAVSVVGYDDSAALVVDAPDGALK